jgi:ABC-type phosphate transport system substrate-binding protein
MKIVFGFAVFITVCMMFFVTPSIAQTDEYLVVANRELQGSSIEKDSLKGIYLREIKTWGKGGAVIIPVDLNSENDFYKNLFQKTRTQMQAYWLNMRIKHSVDLPVVKKDADSVKEFIAANKNAIGFLRSSDLDDRVKVLKVVN